MWSLRFFPVRWNEHWDGQSKPSGLWTWITALKAGAVWLSLPSKCLFSSQAPWPTERDVEAYEKVWAKGLNKWFLWNLRLPFSTNWKRDFQVNHSNNSILIVSSASPWKPSTSCVYSYLLFDTSNPTSFTYIHTINLFLRHHRNKKYFKQLGFILARGKFGIEGTF